MDEQATSVSHEKKGRSKAVPKKRKNKSAPPPVADSNWKSLVSTGKIRKRKRNRYTTSLTPSPEKKQASGPQVHPDVLYKKQFSQETTRIVALDCEMVGVGLDQQSRLGRVCIINEFGHILLDQFCRPNERITDFRTRWSGIRAVDLINAPSVQVVQQQATDLLRGKTIILKSPISTLLSSFNFSECLNECISRKPESYLAQSCDLFKFIKNLTKLNGVYLMLWLSLDISLPLFCYEIEH